MTESRIKNRRLNHWQTSKGHILSPFNQTVLSIDKQIFSYKMYAYGVTSAGVFCPLLEVFPCTLIFFKASHRDTFTHCCCIKVNEVITASLEGTTAAAVEGLERSYFASPAAPCSSPGGQSSQTLPPSRRLHLPAVAATPGRSFFGPLCRELTAPPL